MPSVREQEGRWRRSSRSKRTRCQARWQEALPPNRTLKMSLMLSLVFDPPDQNPLEAGKRVEASGEIEEPGLGGDGQEAKVGGPRDGGEGGDRHARHLQLPRKQWEHQELAAVVEQPEVGLGIGFFIRRQNYKTLKSSKVSAPQ